jgi:outer membrane biosynthesis protein TonB
MTDVLEKNNKRIAMLTSLGLHAVILLLLFYIVAWRAPNPPLPEYGVELNFGMDAQGSGAVQPDQPVGTVQAETQEQQIEDLPVPESEVIPEEDPQETPAETTPTQTEAVSQVESPVKVEEPKDKKPVDKPIDKPVKKVEEVKPEVKPTEEIPKAVYKPKSETATQGNASAKPGAPGSQGDDVDKTGDKGDPAGTLDSKALYGKQGGGGGGISMTGFNGFGAPSIETPSLPDESYGIYEFKVKVDDQGYVVSVTSLQRGLSFEAERRLKAAIQKLQFIPKGNNVPAVSEGTITFKVVSAEH